MEIYGKTTNSAPNNLTNITSGVSAAGTGAASGAESFASALKASLSASQPETAVVEDNLKNDALAYDWKNDTTDYVSLMADAESQDAFAEYALMRGHQADAQGIDISGNGSERSTTELYNEWYDNGGKNIGQYFIANLKREYGYYGMDSDGHWGYYLDAGLTQKHPNGGWDLYKASDGGRALFDTSRGYLWPSSVRDESRAGKTVTLVADAKAFEVRYDERGYPTSVTNLSQTRGVKGGELDLPTARALDDRGVGSQELLRQASGVDYAGPGSGVSFDDVKGAQRKDWDAVMANGGKAPMVSAKAQPEPEETDAASAASSDTPQAEAAKDAAPSVAATAEPAADDSHAASAAATAPRTDGPGGETARTVGDDAADYDPVSLGGSSREGRSALRETMEQEMAQSFIDALEKERAAETERAQEATRREAAAPTAGTAATEPTISVAQVNAAIKAGVLTPDVLAAYEYYNGRPYGA